MTETPLRKEALELLTLHPAQVGRLCGFDKLSDPLHGAWLRLMLHTPSDLTLLAHRGSYKTTCLTLAIAILMVTEPERNILFLRKTEEDVCEVLRQVKTLLLSEAMQCLTEQLWGRPVTLTRATAYELTTGCYASPRGAVQLLGQGIGGSLTGKHADVIFTDDIVNLQDRLSPAQRERTKSIYRQLQNIRNPGGRLINTGTPWHPEDAISLMPEVHRFDCYATGLLTAAQLDSLRSSMLPSLFAANYELKHIADEDALLDTAPAFTDDERLLRGGFAHIDASYGGGDYTALTIGQTTAEGSMVLLGRLWRRPVDAVMEDIAAECALYLASPIWCETNGDKGYLARELRRMGLMVRTYAESMPKHMKISAYLRKWWSRVRFLRSTDEGYIGQLMGYSVHAAHDDAPDSAACMIRLLEKRIRE